LGILGLLGGRRVSNDEINDLICDVFGLAFTFVWGLAFALGATDFFEVCGFDCFGFADEALFAATLGVAFLGVVFGFAFAVVFLVDAFFAILISPFWLIYFCLCKHYM
jgi:fatty acid desaturase